MLLWLVDQHQHLKNKGKEWSKMQLNSIGNKPGSKKELQNQRWNSLTTIDN
jgi:hypothetical protein